MIKHIIVLILLCGTVSAYCTHEDFINELCSPEGLETGEVMQITGTDSDLWQSGNEYYTTTYTGVYVYRPESSWKTSGMGIFSWCAWQYLILFNDDTSLSTSWVLQKKTYNNVTESYENSGGSYVEGYVMEVSGGTFPETKTVPTNIIIEYFTEHPVTDPDNWQSPIETYNPDYIEITIVSNDGMTEESSETIGMTMTDSEAMTASGGNISGTGSSSSGYGMADSSMGSGGGKGEIYDGVGEGLGDGSTGIAEPAIELFNIIIPFLFIGCCALFIWKVLGFGR